MRKRISQTCSRIFYGPSDWYIEHTSQRTRAAINTWLLILWIFPGLVIWYVLKSALWFIGFMSIYAIWTGHLGAASAETPVEHETNVNGNNNDVDVNVKVQDE